MHSPPRHVVAEKIAADKRPAEERRESVAGIDCSAEHDVAAIDAVVLHMGKESISIWIVQWSMLTEVLLEIAPLDGVPEQSAAVGTVEKVAIPIERQSVNVASAFGEKLQFMGDRVIAPDTLLKLESANLGCGGAAVQSVEPAVGAPGEMVRHRLGIL